MSRPDHCARYDRALIVATARRWLGTPYHHQASMLGVGCDCLGLVRGVFRDLEGLDPEMPPPYTRDWAEATGTETLLAAAGRHLLSVAMQDARPGDVLVFRYRPGVPAKHCGILASASSFVHASEGNAAAEVALQPWWRRRIVGVFAFPGVRD